MCAKDSNGVCNNNNLSLLLWFYLLFYPIAYDFDKLQMEFHVQGRKVALRGAKTPSTKLFTNKALTLAVNQGAELCFLQVEDYGYSFTFPPAT